MELYLLFATVALAAVLAAFALAEVVLDAIVLTAKHIECFLATSVPDLIKTSQRAANC